jgi:hypothetical protein
MSVRRSSSMRMLMVRVRAVVAVAAMIAPYATPMSRRRYPYASAMYTRCQHII